MSAAAIAGVALAACVVALALAMLALGFARRARRDVTGLRTMYDSALASAVSWRAVAIELVTPSGLARDHVRRWCVDGCAGAGDPGHLIALPGVVFDLARSVEHVEVP